MTIDELHTTPATTLADRLTAAQRFNIGFPGATDFDYTELADLLATHLLNNVGDPYVDGPAVNQTKAYEREVVGFVADLLRAPSDDRWGYVTSGASEGTLHALHVARGRLPGGVVYHSTAAHPSVAKAVDLLSMQSVVIRVDETGQLDYQDLAEQIRLRRHRPAIVVATAGTTLTEAVDDLHQIIAVLDQASVTRRFLHVDAALAGIPLALLDPDSRPGMDFADGADSVIISGHKFIGSPVPCGVLVTRARQRSPEEVSYVGSPDTTLLGSRSGHAPLILAHALRRHGHDGLRARAEQSRQLAAYAVAKLTGIGWSAWRNPHAFTVVLRTPPPAVTDRWVLAENDGVSHIVCMPGLTAAQIDEFVLDLYTALAPTGAPSSAPSPAAPPELDGRRKRNIRALVPARREPAS